MKMMSKSIESGVALLLLSIGSPIVSSFSSVPQSKSNVPYRNAVVLNGATGGWGIGNSRDMVPEEFAKSGDRRAFEGYEISDRGEFMRKVKKEHDDLKKEELDELLGVAKIAGIDVDKKKVNSNMFDPSLFQDDGDDLDVSIDWNQAVDPFAPRKKQIDESITRMDEDTGAPGVW